MRPTPKIALHFCYIDHIYMQFSLLNSSDINMVPQYCSYGSAGVPAVPATILMSARVGPVKPSTQSQSALPPPKPPLQPKQYQVETSRQSFRIFRTS